MYKDYLDCSYESLFKHISNSLMNAILERGFHNAVIGISGGLDSALVLRMLTEKRNKIKTTAYFLPYKSSSSQSMNDAYLVAEYSGIPIETVSITKQIDSYFENQKNASKLRIGNKCARERMAILFDKSAEKEALVIGTSNRSELIMGYGTLYGDLGYSINPIGRLFKTQIREMARVIDIPEQIIDKAPSADLWEHQTDEDDMGVTYETIDSFASQYFDCKKSIEDIISSGISDKQCRKILNAYEKNKFKSQSALIIEPNLKGDKYE